MVLKSATSLLGALEGVGPENLDFLGSNGIRFPNAISGPKKVSIFRAHPFQCPSPQKHYIPHHKNNRYEYIYSYYDTAIIKFNFKMLT